MIFLVVFHRMRSLCNKTRKNGVINIIRRTAYYGMILKIESGNKFEFYSATGFNRSRRFVIGASFVRRVVGCTDYKSAQAGIMVVFSAHPQKLWGRGGGQA